MSRQMPDDTFLWLTVLISLSTATLVVPRILTYVRQLVEVSSSSSADAPPDRSRQHQHQRLQVDGEDALSASTLRTLATAPSHHLRSSAIKIICARVVKDQGGAKRQLLRDLASRNSRRRERAINALWLLLFHDVAGTAGRSAGGARQTKAFCDAESLKAVVDALVHVLPLHEEYGPEEAPRSPIKVKARPNHERSLMHILNELMMYVTPLALSAGLVGRWLSRYPFPCADERWREMGFRKSDVAGLFKTGNWSQDDALMAGVMRHLLMDGDGMTELRKHGLHVSNYKEGLCGTSIRYGEAPSWNRALEDIRDIEVEVERDTAGGRPGSSWGREPAEGSTEEGNMRRRRNRETIVVAEPGETFTEGNILMRENSRVGLVAVDGVTEGEMADFEGRPRRRVNIAPTVVEGIAERLTAGDGSGE